jgi:hypothetical protein
MTLTIKIDKYGEGRVCIPLPDPVIQDILARAERGDPPPSSTIWDVDSGIWADFEGPEYIRYGVGPDGLTMSLLLGPRDPLDGTADPELTLDDELLFIKTARLVLGPYLDQLKKEKTH